MPYKISIPISVLTLSIQKFQLQLYAGLLLAIQINVTSKVTIWHWTYNFYSNFGIDLSLQKVQLMNSLLSKATIFSLNQPNKA